MLELWLYLAFVGFCAIFVGLASVGLVALYVVRKHPAEYDPARNARRYTMPALAFLILSVVGLIAFAFSLVAAGVTALAT